MYYSTSWYGILVRARVQRAGSRLLVGYTIGSLGCGTDLSRIELLFAGATLRPPRGRLRQSVHAVARPALLLLQSIDQVEQAHTTARPREQSQ